MTALKPMIAAIDELLAENAAAPRLPSVADLVHVTGLHPIANPRAPGRHAATWTPSRVTLDAELALSCYPATGRRVDTDAMGGPLARLLGGCRALTVDQVRAAEWARAAVSR